MKVANISELGRATQGVKLIRIDEGDEIAAITKLDIEEEAEIIAELEGEALLISELPADLTDTTNTEENTSEEDNSAPLA
jgi:DNA gyrase subunit A